MNKNKSSRSKSSPRQKIKLILFGLFLCIVLVETGLRIAGFLILSLQEYNNKLIIREKNEYHIMCIGESTTAGGSYESSYPGQLQEILNNKNLGINFKVINAGIAGTKTGAIVSILEKNLDKYNPDMVIVMMGINDEVNVAPYKTGLAGKLSRLKLWNFTKIFKEHIENKLEEMGLFKSKDDSFILSNILSSLKEEEEDAKYSFDSDRYIEIGMSYHRNGMYDMAEKMFRKAIKRGTVVDEAYTWLGMLYSDLGEHEKAENFYKKAIGIKENNWWAHLKLGECYMSQGNDEKGQEIFDNISLEIDDPGTLQALGDWCRVFGDYDKAEKLFKRCIKVAPEKNWGYFSLIYLYGDIGKDKEIKKVFEAFINSQPEEKTIQIYEITGGCYFKFGKYKLAKEYLRKAKRLRLKYYNSIRRDNYLKLRDIIVQRRIKLICVQYPMRSVDALKRIFLGKDITGILFIDNESTFKEAIKMSSYEEYFMDMFGGNFGHCTPKGNRLLAENIAEGIIKKYLAP